MKTAQTRSSIIGLAIVAAIVIMGSAARAADGTWTNTAGGTWGTAGNWQGSVLPDNGHANLTLSGVNYTVDYTVAGPSISNLFVQNTAGKLTTLNLSAPLAHAGGYIDLANAAVNVTNGAVWTYPGVNRDATKLLDIRNNSIVTLCGGSVQFTNMLRATATQRSYINVGNGSTGTLLVPTGHFNFSATNNAPNNSHVMYVGYNAGGNGTLEIGDGAKVTLGLGGGAGGNLWPLFVAGNGARGKVVVAGELAFPYVGPYTGAGANNGSYGEVIVTNNGTISGGGRWTFGSGGNCIGIVRFVGTNMMTAGTYGWSHLNVGFNNNIAGCSTGLVEMTSGSILISGMLTLGVADGNTAYKAKGSMDLTGGAVNAQTLYGTWIGWGRQAGTAEGTLNMTGGSLYISNGGAAQPIQYPAGVAPWGWAVNGLVIGIISKSNSVDDTSPDSRATGTLNLSGGAITNKYQLVIGCNGGTGTLHQTGGSMVHTPVDATRFSIIGYGYGTNAYSGAGHGTYNMSGGTHTTSQRVFVGGVPTNVQWFAKAGGIGLLRVTGGTFTCNNTLYVGANGTGTLALGSNGVVHGSSVVFSNAPSSTLQFDVDAVGGGTLQVDGALTIAAGTKLVVNVNELPPESWTKLVDCGSRTGSFADLDITVTGGGYVYQNRDEDIWLFTPRGTTIMVR